MHIYICICMCVCAYIHTHLHTNTHFIYIYLYTHAHTHTHTYICTYAHKYMHVHMDTSVLHSGYCALCWTFYFDISFIQISPETYLNRKVNIFSIKVIFYTDLIELKKMWLNWFEKLLAKFFLTSTYWIYTYNFSSWNENWPYAIGILLLLEPLFLLLSHYST